MTASDMSLAVMNQVNFTFTFCTWLDKCSCIYGRQGGSHQTRLERDASLLHVGSSMVKKV